MHTYSPKCSPLAPVLALLAASLPALAAQERPYELLPHSDSAYAHELYRLQQVSLLLEQQAAAKGTPAEGLWKSQLILARWEDLTKDRAAIPGLTADYLAALHAYTKSQDKGLDGAWALDHAQFILARLAQPILTQMEYFGNNRRDRDALTPLATAAREMLALAGRSLEADMKRLEEAKPFDEKAYGRTYAAAIEVKYYSAWQLYFGAMAIDPAADDDARKKQFAQAIVALADWAVDAPDNGVNAQAYLLRGKAYSEAGGGGDFDKALADYAKAQTDKAPNWVQYQARYQTVVTNLRARDLAAAQRNLDDFKKWIPKANTEALLSADMLAFRVAWAVADNRLDSAEKRQGRKAALDAMAAITQRDPRFRDLVYEQIALLIPDNADLNALFPLQQLAVARAAGINQNGATADSRDQLRRAVAAAQAARTNPQATRADQIEATFLLGVGHALLGELTQAAQFEVDFAAAAPQDPRARQVIDLALQQIGELRKQAATGPATATAPLPPELRALAEKALDISIKTFGDRQWLYAQGRLREESGQADQAAAIYDQIKPDERTFLEARYRLVALAAERFSNLEGKPAEQSQAAAQLFAACQKFTDVLERPPAATPREVLQAAKSYQHNIWLLEAATAVSPAVKDAQVALDRLARLDTVRDQLTDSQRTASLQYRMQAYLLAGQQDQAAAALDEFVKAAGGTGTGLAVIRGMALATVDDIDKTTDPQQVKKLSSYVVMLLNPLIRQATAEAKTDSAFEYRLIQADMMVKTGQFKEAVAQAVALQEERPPDIRAFLTQARALFAEAQATGQAKQYAVAQDIFTRLLASPRMQPGSEGFWEAWLRTVQSMEAQTIPGSRDEIKNRLGDLKAVYGAKFGGERFAPDFKKLSQKYDLP